MRLVICPGVHDFHLTQSFLQGWLLAPGYYSFDQEVLVFPADELPSYSAVHILQFLHDTIQGQTADECYRERCGADHRSSLYQVPLVFISFSAGVAGAIGAAWVWQQLGGQVKAFIALDGWGVPLYGNFPIHRLSHDYFTHWSSAILGPGEESFYADPPVEHLHLWGSPQTTLGYRITQSSISVFDSWITHPRTTAAEFLTQLLNRYCSRI